MDVIWLKVIAFFTFILVGGGFSLLPWGFQKVQNTSKRTIIILAECFAGGVFLGTGWVHLLPESANGLASIDNGVPLANMLSVCGFLIVFLLEKVFFLSEEDQNSFIDDSITQTHRRKVIPESSIKLVQSSDIEILPTSATESSNSPHPQNISLSPDLVTQEITPEYSRINHSHDHGTSALLDPVATGTSSLLPYVLMIVLSVHSIIAGLTIGVAQSIETMAPLFIAVISHKWTESFALGVSLLQLSDFRKFLKCILIYTMMVPSGLVIGSILSVALESETATLLTAILNGIASGTFIYIALVDILLEQFTDAKHKFFKYIFCFIGFISITGMFLLFDEN